MLIYVKNCVLEFDNMGFVKLFILEHVNVVQYLVVFGLLMLCEIHELICYFTCFSFRGLLCAYMCIMSIRETLSFR